LQDKQLISEIILQDQPTEAVVEAEGGVPEESHVNISEKHLQELSLFMTETGAEITEEYSSQFSQILNNLGLLSEFAGTGPVPLEVWTGIAQALAYASGYSVILKAEILEPSGDDPEIYRTVGKREIANVEPTLFVKEG
jgi:hypothetical protein